ncbi:MAG TPA: hypothetical protein VK842_06740, partial [bacterium]|nr:hypothetical protein [bacterium]
ADAKDSTNKEQFQVRVIEARLKAATDDPQASVAVLASLALSEADVLDAEAQALAPLTAPGGRPIGMLRLVLGLLRTAHTTEAKARALFSLARQGRHWDGVERARVLDADHEQLYLAIRRFEALLEAGKAWDAPDIEWLRLRALSLPARLQQTVADLRSAAETAAQSPLPETLAAARRLLMDRGFKREDALAWVLAGFKADEAQAWIDAGQDQPSQAALWRARGMDLGAAQAWGNFDLLADEAALFQACGVQDPSLAHQLRAALGDVELLPAWHRAGYAPDEVLALKAEGCRGPDQAPPPRPKEAPPPPPAPTLVINRSALMEGVVVDLTKPAKADSEAKPAPAAAAGQAGAALTADFKGDGVNTFSRMVKAELSWGRLRAQQLFGVEIETEAEALAVPLPPGSAWLGWGSLQSHPIEAGGDAGAFVWPLGGSSLLVMGASELLAPAGKVVEVPDMRPDPLWQEALDPLRIKLGLPKHAGSWMLMSTAEGGALAWGLVHPAGPPPWSTAVDYQEFESWTARWARKTEEWGEEGKAPNAKVGKLKDGSWWIALPEATAGAGAGPQSLAFTVVKPAWLESLQEFCLKMEMPAKAGKWRLFGQALAPLP